MFKKYYLWEYIGCGMLILFFAECKIHYDPPVNSAKTHFLVVEGYININGMTNINLTRTRTISRGDTARYINETGANVVIEDEQGNKYPLNEIGNGNYSADYSLNTSNQYRIKIKTTDNKEYISDFVTPKLSSPIDNLYWDFNNTSVWVYLDSHLPNNQTKYYRWSYVETWEFHSQYNSVLIYNPADSTVLARTAPVYVCYQTQNSSDVILSSPIQLQQGFIYKKPLVFIPPHDKRISVLYSVLVTQYALDSTTYSYWDALKNNSVDIGSVFGAQPDQIKGNIHNINDIAEKVIGYIDAGIPATKRLYISNSSMPSDWNKMPNCFELYVSPSKIAMAKYFSSNSFVPIRKDTTLSGGLKGYFSASGRCVDCTLTGSNVKPAFWP